MRWSRACARGKLKKEDDVREALVERLVGDAAGAGASGAASRGRPSGPTVILVVGVNGVGKTTTVAKLAHRLKARGAEGAARRGRHLPRRRGRRSCRSGPSGSACRAWRARRAATRRRWRSTRSRRRPRAGSTPCIIDTAGRLHTQDGLMDELRKVVRVVDRGSCRARRTRRCSCSTARWARTRCSRAGCSREAVPPTGLIVTKLDGTARGGAVAALRRELGVPDPVPRPGRGRRRPRAVRCARLRRGLLRRTRTAAQRPRACLAPPRCARHPVKFLKGVGEQRADALRPPRHPHRARPRCGTSRTATSTPPPSPRSRRRAWATRSPWSGGSWRRGCCRPGRGSGSSTRCCATTRGARVRLAGPGVPRPHHRGGAALLVSGPVRFYHGRQMAPREFIILGDADDAEAAPERADPPGLSGHRGAVAQADPRADRPAPRRADPARRRPAARRRCARRSACRRCRTRCARCTARPASAEAELGRRRLAFDELFDLQLMLARARALAKRDSGRHARSSQARPSPRGSRESLPWTLTGRPAAGARARSPPT